MDEEETRGGDKLQGGKKKDKNTAARDGVKSKSIFSPVFSFFRGGPTVSSEANDKITSAARSQPKGKQPARPAARPKPKPTTQTTRTRPEPSRPSAPPPRAQAYRPCPTCAAKGPSGDNRRRGGKRVLVRRRRRPGGEAGVTSHPMWCGRCRFGASGARANRRGGELGERRSRGD